VSSMEGMGVVRKLILSIIYKMTGGDKIPSGAGCRGGFLAKCFR
jgi:hypothetical protein